MAQYVRYGVRVKLVIIGQLIRRMQFASCRNFNHKVTETNERIKDHSTPFCRIHFWGHIGFCKDLHFLGRDGVHFLCTPDEDLPMGKYRRSIRNLAFKAFKASIRMICNILI